MNYDITGEAMQPLMVIPLSITEETNMTQAEALTRTPYYRASDVEQCPKCSSRMVKAVPIQGLSALSERIIRCPRCRYITLTERPANER